MSFESLTASHKLAMTLDMLSPPSIGLPPNVWGVLSISMMSVLRPLTAALNLGVNSDGDIAALRSDDAVKRWSQQRVKKGSSLHRRGRKNSETYSYGRPSVEECTVVETL